MISTTKQFIFTHIPGTGGTTIENHLKSFAEGEVQDKDAGLIVPSQRVKNKIAKVDVDQYLKKNYKHATLSELKKILPTDEFDNYYKFTIVRNPLHKAISMCKFTKTPGHNLEAIKKITKSHAWLWKQDMYVEEKGVNLSNKIYKFEDVYPNQTWKEIFNDIKVTPPTKIQHSNPRNSLGPNKVEVFFTKEVREYLKDFLHLDYVKYYPNEI
jgi:Fe-S cluster biosynthesis and repair protein YggX